MRLSLSLSLILILRPELFLGGSAFAAWKWTLHCHDFVVLDSESYSTLTQFLRDLLARVAPKEDKECKQADQIFKSSSTKFAPCMVAKARWSARCKGDSKEIARVKATLTYSRSTATTRRWCSSFFRSYAVGYLLSWTFRAPTDAACLNDTTADLRRRIFFAKRMFV